MRRTASQARLHVAVCVTSPALRENETIRKDRIPRDLLQQVQEPQNLLERAELPAARPSPATSSQTNDRARSRKSANFSRPSCPIWTLKDRRRAARTIRPTKASKTICIAGVNLPARQEPSSSNTLFLFSVTSVPIPSRNTAGPRRARFGSTRNRSASFAA